MNIREMAVLEAKAAGEISPAHIPGKGNPADLFTKEQRDNTQFLSCRSILASSSSALGGSEAIRRLGALFSASRLSVNQSSVSVLSPPSYST